MTALEWLSLQVSEENGRYWNQKQWRLEYRRNFNAVAWIRYDVFTEKNWMNVVDLFEQVHFEQSYRRFVDEDR